MKSLCQGIKLINCSRLYLRNVDTIRSDSPLPCPRPRPPTLVGNRAGTALPRPRPRPRPVESAAIFRASIVRVALSWTTVSGSSSVEGTRCLCTCTASRIWAVLRIRSVGTSRCCMVERVLSVNIRSWKICREPVAAHL